MKGKGEGRRVKGENVGARLAAPGREIIHAEDYWLVRESQRQAKMRREQVVREIKAWGSMLLFALLFFTWWKWWRKF